MINVTVQGHFIASFGGETKFLSQIVYLLDSKRRENINDTLINAHTHAHTNTHIHMPAQRHTLHLLYKI